MFERLKYSVPGLAISLIAGAMGHYLFGLEFWSATLIVAVAIIANGFFVLCEDKGTFND